MTEIYSQYALPVGTMVQEYRIIEILGIGSFGIVYKAENKYFSEIVALKEFLPTELAGRPEGDSRVVPHSSESAKAFEYARSKFLAEAKVLRELGHPEQHPNIVRVRQFIEANDTAYMVMDFEKGQPLSRILEKHGTLVEVDLKGILEALLDGLARVHDASVWHRDIKPSNILIRADGSPVLIDFGAARKDITDSDRSIMAIFSPTYAAIEQSQPAGEQGPWTDIYGLGATLYKAVTGHVPTNSAKRLQGEAYVSAATAAKGTYSPSFLAAIDAALELYPKDRPQSISEWRELFLPAIDESEGKTIFRPIQGVESAKRKSGYHATIAVAIAGVLAIAGWLGYRVIQQPFDNVTATPIPIKEHQEVASSVPEDAKNLQTPQVTAQLSIESVPPSAMVFIDGESMGTAPVQTELSDGTHCLRLHLNGHYDWESDILIEQSGKIPIRIPLLAK